MTIPPSLTTALADRYTLERELGRGGMATVYLAHDLKHDRPVALKVLRPELAAVLGGERFLREIRLTAQLQHPHIVTLIDSGDAGGTLYYVLPYIEGESLRQRLIREGQLPLDEALRLAREVAEALNYAHGQGIVHRDVKPENILLSRGHALVADFGIALAVTQAGGGRLTETGLSLGTPAYMSPEQAMAEPRLDGRSDQYSLACVLYEMLAGEPPYTGPTAQAIMAKRLGEPVPHLGTLRQVPARVEAAVQRALSKSPVDRFVTVAEFGAALERDTRKPRLRRRLAVLLGGIAAFTILGLLAFVLWPRLTPVPRAAVDERSLAVLPLVNVGGDVGEEYLSDGLTEELIAALARVPGLRVAARSSAFAFKGKPLDVKEVGSKLGVANVLEGSVRHSGNQLRVTAELVKVGDGLTLWSQTYARDMKDVFQVQADLATSIAGSLQLTLTEVDSARLINRPTASLEAYNLYLQGMYFWNKRNEDGFRRAKTFFEQAIALDSGYAQAWVGLGAAYTLLGDWAFDVPARMLSLGRHAALKALSLDSTLAGAHAVLGYIKMDDYDLSGGESELRRARELEPSNPLVRHWHAWTLVSLGRVDEAIEEIRKARDLDPLSLPINRSVGRILAVGGRFQEAMAQLQYTLALEPGFAVTHGTIGQVYLAQGKWREAVPELEADIAARPVGQLAFAYARSGRREKAKELLEECLAASKRHYVSSFDIARIYLGLGDTERALDWLQRAYQDRSLTPTDVWPDTIFSDIRRDPRFVALARKVGIKE